jgi:hypothetical protein
LPAHYEFEIINRRRHHYCFLIHDQGFAQNFPGVLDGAEGGKILCIDGAGALL